MNSNKKINLPPPCKLVLTFLIVENNSRPIFPRPVEDGRLPLVVKSEKSQPHTLKEYAKDPPCKTTSTSTSPLGPIKTDKSPQDTHAMKKKEKAKRRKRHSKEHLQKIPSNEHGSLLENKGLDGDQSSNKNNGNSTGVMEILDWFKPLPPLLSPMQCSSAQWVRQTSLIKFHIQCVPLYYILYRSYHKTCDKVV